MASSVTASPLTSTISGLNRAAALEPELEPLPRLRRDALWEGAGGDRENEVVAARAVRILRFHPDGPALADLQAGHGPVEAGDDLAGAERERQRLAPLGRVEHRPVVETAGVVDADGVAGLRRHRSGEDGGWKMGSGSRRRVQERRRCPARQGTNVVWVNVCFAVPACCPSCVVGSGSFSPASSRSPGSGASAQTLDVGGRRCAVPNPTLSEVVETVRIVEAVKRRQPGGASLLAAAGEVTIPVAFHVITRGTEGDVPLAWIEAQIDTLNAGFAASGYRFVLALVERVENEGLVHRASSSTPTRRRR